MILWAKVGAILAAVLLVFFAGYHVGGMAPKLAQANATIKATITQQRETGIDETAIANEAKVLEDAELAPIASPVVRMCVSPAAAAAVRAATPAGLLPHAPAAADAGAPVPVVVGPDIGPSLLRAGTVADAQVKALQGYVSRVCLRGK